MSEIKRYGRDPASGRRVVEYDDGRIDFAPATAAPAAPATNAPAPGGAAAPARPEQGPGDYLKRDLAQAGLAPKPGSAMATADALSKLPPEARDKDPRYKKLQAADSPFPDIVPGAGMALRASAKAPAAEVARITKALDQKIAEIRASGAAPRAINAQIQYAKDLAENAINEVGRPLEAAGKNVKAGAGKAWDFTKEHWPDALAAGAGYMGFGPEGGVVGAAVMPALRKVLQQVKTSNGGMPP